MPDNPAPLDVRAHEVSVQWFDNRWHVYCTVCRDVGEPWIDQRLAEMRADDHRKARNA